MCFGYCVCEIALFLRFFFFLEPVWKYAFNEGNLDVIVAKLCKVGRRYRIGDRNTTDIGRYLACVHTYITHRSAELL